MDVVRSQLARNRLDPDRHGQLRRPAHGGGGRRRRPGRRATADKIVIATGTRPPAHQREFDERTVIDSDGS
jgi:pyruvate/2-oxoglutarate dehydrogenase complex dihydrolipoamide dehydrogenase (E3) component